MGSLSGRVRGTREIAFPPLPFVAIYEVRDEEIIILRILHGVHRPSSSVARMPARVRSERTSLSNCARAASTPSISFPVDVSSIGSVADRKEMPRDFRCAGSAK